RVLLALAHDQIPDVEAEGPAAGPPLLHWLQNGSPYVQILAARGLARLGDPRAVEAIVATACSVKYPYPAVLIRVAAELGREQTVEHLSGKVREGKLIALEMLAEAGGPQALSRLTEALRHPDPQFQFAAAQALGRIKDAGTE